MVLLAGVAAGFGQQSSPPPNPFDQFQAAIRAERAADKAKPADQLAQRRDRRANDAFLQTVRDALARDDYETALTYVSQLGQATDSDDVRKACDALTETLSKKRQEKDNAFVAKVDAILKGVSDTIVAAKVPKDMDATLQELGHLAESTSNSNRYADGGQNRAVQQLQGAINFVSHWQDYLLALNRGDENASANALRNLAENNGGYNLSPLIPRSEILARIPPNRSISGEVTTAKRERNAQAPETNTAVAAILDQAHTLADIPTALGKLLALTAEVSGGNGNYADSGSDLGAAVASLQNLQKTQAELLAGLSTTIGLTSQRANANSRPAVETKIAPLRAELIGLALPRLLNASTEKQAAGEGVDAFLARLIEAAKKQSDWAAVTRGLESTEALTTASSGIASNSQIKEAFKQFLAGLNLEAAGQYQQAVMSYMTALKTGVQDLPTGLIGEHLAAIEKAHAKGYSDANAYLLNPPVPRYPDGMAGPFGPRGGMYDPRLGRPGYPGTPAEQATPPPALAVPAVPTASPTPAVTASPAPPAKS